MDQASDVEDMVMSDSILQVFRFYIVDNSYFS